MTSGSATLNTSLTLSQRTCQAVETPDVLLGTKFFSQFKSKFCKNKAILKRCGAVRKKVHP